jgi:hypothetical protein
MRDFGSFKESYFTEKRVISVAVNFPLSGQDKTRKLAGELEITDDGTFLKTFYERREGDDPLDYKEEIKCLTGEGDSKIFHFFNLKFLKLGWRQIEKGISIGEQKFRCDDVMVSNQRVSSLSEIKIYIDGLKEFLGPTNEICDFLDGVEKEGETPVVKLQDSVFLYDFSFNKSWDPSEYISSSKVEPSADFVLNESINFSEKKVKELVRKYQILHCFLTGRNYKIERVVINREAEFYSDSFRVFSADLKKKFSMLKWGHNLSPQFQNLYGTDYKIPGEAIFKWFNLLEDEFDIYELFYGARFVRDKYQRFINLYICLEFMVQGYRKQYFETEDFARIAKKVEEIINVEAPRVPSKKKKDFLKSLQRVNEERAPTLELIKSCAKEEGLIDLWALIGIKDDVFKKIAQDRNHIVHGRIGQVSGVELYNDVLELSVYFLILQRLGIDREILISKLGVYIDYNRVRNNLERFGFTFETNVKIVKM